MEYVEHAARIVLYHADNAEDIYICAHMHHIIFARLVCINFASAVRSLSGLSSQLSPSLVGFVQFYSAV